ncbi:hypothetical protein ACN38_g470 [Penicillium nordicum]|uniref:Uncharacterized protein n=1 Tax=Penicillium nordicum TaxID=229535 RepID=A0A0M9WKM6_9EURO|nr:hypothetical protein ACN38_g470 [Penicillium nordicum]
MILIITHAEFDVNRTRRTKSAHLDTSSSGLTLPGETSDSLVFPSTIEASQALESDDSNRQFLSNTEILPSLIDFWEAVCHVARKVSFSIRRPIAPLLVP